MKRSRYTEEQIIAILKEHEAGTPVAELGTIRNFVRGGRLKQLRIGASQQLVEDSVGYVRVIASRHPWAFFLRSCSARNS